MDVILAAFLSHYLADWVLQSPKMGREKSSKLTVLAMHISIIFGIIFLGTSYFLGVQEALKLSAINALTHAIIDWNIWRFYRVSVYLRNKDRDIKDLQKNYKYWLDPVFGYFLGFDQLLHFIILYVIYR